MKKKPKKIRLAIILTEGCRSCSINRYFRTAMIMTAVARVSGMTAKKQQYKW